MNVPKQIRNVVNACLRVFECACVCASASSSFEMRVESTRPIPSGFLVTHDILCVCVCACDLILLWAS